MKRHHQTLLPTVITAACALFALATARSQNVPPVDAEGSIHVPAFVLPESSLLTPESRAELARERDPAQDAFTLALKSCPSIQNASAHDIPAIRECQARAFEATPFYRSLRERYRVTVTSQTMAGVPTEVVAPQDGIAARNERRVLINLHGGSFLSGTRINSQVESIPIAAVAHIKVISVDYRLAPQFRFPAASDDVIAVYREVLKAYAAGNVGLYGCSAGGALAAQVIARLLVLKLPRPGAVGLFCYGAGRALDATHERWVRSDSAYLVGALTGRYEELAEPLAYYRGVNLKDPLVSPGDHDDIMAQFPPTLLISGTRDYLLSSVVSTHAQLVRLGVDADLHVWEGMQHAFIYFPELPEAREAYDVITRFFDRHLKVGK